MCITLILLCLLSGITWSSAEVVFHIRSLNSSMQCIQSLKNPASATVLENGHLNLSVIFDGRNSSLLGINYFQCFANDNETDVFSHNPKKPPRNSVTSEKATLRMSGIWRCRILTNENTIIQPIEEFSTTSGEVKNYTALYCHVKVHVRLSETPQTILVNNMILPTNRINDIEDLIDHSAVYSYLDGEIVNVKCIPGDNIIKANATKQHNIAFQYDYAEKLDDMFKNLPINNLGYGFRTKLDLRHHNSVMTCSLMSPNDNTTIKVTFVLKKSLDSFGDLQVNGLIARPPHCSRNRFNVINYYIAYQFFDGEKVDLDCNIKKNYSSADSETQSNSCNSGIRTYSNPLVSPFNATCLICNPNILEDITIQSKTLATDFKELNRLTADLSEKNTLIEVYQHGQTRHSWMYYEFDEGDTVNLTCTMSQDTYSVLEVKYEFHNDTKAGNKTLTSRDDKSLFDCTLSEKSNDKFKISPIVYKSIRVLFRQRISTLTTPGVTQSEGNTSTQKNELDTLPEDVPIWVIAIGAVVVIIVLCCVVIAIYKMRKQSQKRETDVNNYGSLQNEISQASIPAYPEQWSRNDEQNYHVPMDIRNDSTIYAEPVRGPEDPYATPIPRNQRPPKRYQSKDNPGPTYAELDLGPDRQREYTNMVDSPYSTVKELYTQVIPKGLRKNNQSNYDNVFPDSSYMNSGNTEYVEPTYCQAFRK